MEEKLFTIFWLGKNEPSLFKGINIFDAFVKNGYENGTDLILDIYVEGDKRNDYYYNTENGRWFLK